MDKETPKTNTIPGPSEIYELLRNIKDPEYPNTLEDLKIVSPDSITVDNNKHSVTVIFTPTIAHCSMCMLIGLSIKTKLQDVLPPYTKLLIQITAGSHDDEESVNKQLADKERVAAAMENSRIAAVVHSCCTYNPNVDDYGNDIII